MRYSAPPELASLSFDTSEFIRVRPNEYHGPCPLCGGVDRFVLFTDREFPSWNWFCRHCSPSGGWIDEIDKSLSTRSKEELIAIAERSAREAAKRQAEAEREKEMLVTLLNEEMPWRRYHENLRGNSAAMKTWERAGVPRDLQIYWELGVDFNRRMWDQQTKTEFKTHTMTIPIFEAVSRRCMNIRHRLMSPINPGDKYRPEKAGLPSYPFVANVDVPIQNRVLLVEGEKKAMISWICSEDPDLQVIGIPGKEFVFRLEETWANADPLYVCFDPDADDAALNYVKESIVEDARIIRLPQKIDDLIIKYKLDKAWFLGMLNKAWRI